MKFAGELSDRILCLRFAHCGSDLLQSGEYFGWKSSVAPVASMRSRVALDLWNDALSMTTTLSGVSSGASTCATHVLNTEVFV